MTSKPDAIHQLDEGYDAFRRLIQDLPDAAFSETWLGTWNLSQVLAHMSGWFREMTGAFERVNRGERPAPPGVSYADADAWNVGFAANPKPGRAALTDWEEAYAGYRAAAANTPDALFGDDDGKPRIGNRLLQGAGIGHFEEHQGDLEAWLKSRA